MNSKKYKPGQQMSFLEDYVPGEYEKLDEMARKREAEALKEKEAEKERAEKYRKLVEYRMWYTQRKRNNKDLFGGEL